MCREHNCCRGTTTIGNDQYSKCCCSNIWNTGSLRKSLNPGGGCVIPTTHRTPQVGEVRLGVHHRAYNDFYLDQHCPQCWPTPVNDKPDNWESITTRRRKMCQQLNRYWSLNASFFQLLFHLILGGYFVMSALRPNVDSSSPRRHCHINAWLLLSGCIAAVILSTQTYKFLKATALKLIYLCAVME